VGIDHRDVVIELGHPEAMKRAAQQGLGVTLLFRSCVEEDIALGRLQEIKLRDATLAVPLCLVYRKEKRFSRAQQELIDVIRAETR
jgi:DNA-binding transcriptional LysR family regulator